MLDYSISCRLIWKMIQCVISYIYDAFSNNMRNIQEKKVYLFYSWRLYYQWKHKTLTFLMIQMCTTNSYWLVTTWLTGRYSYHANRISVSHSKFCNRLWLYNVLYAFLSHEYTCTSRLFNHIYFVNLSR